MKRFKNRLEYKALERRNSRVFTIVFAAIVGGYVGYAIVQALVYLLGG